MPEHIMTVALSNDVQDSAVHVEDSWAIESLDQLDALARRLDRDASFAAVVERMILLAAEIGATSVVGVSGIGHRVAEAVARRSSVVIWDANRVDDHVMFVEGLASSGVQLAMAMEKAIAGGLVRATAASVVARPETIANLRQMGIDLIALETS
jgi:hypothetical protein